MPRRSDYWREYRAKNRERLKLRDREYRLAHPVPKKPRRPKQSIEITRVKTRERYLRIRRTPKGWARAAWTRLNRRTINGTNAKWDVNTPEGLYLRKGRRLEMTFDEFLEWVIGQWPTIEAIYNSGSLPSIDRIDNDGHYSIDNIQILTHEANSSKGKR